MPGLNSKDKERPAIFHINCYLCFSVVICVVLLLFVLFCLLFVCKYVLPQDDNPIAVNKYIISYIISSILKIFNFKTWQNNCARLCELLCIFIGSCQVCGIGFCGNAHSFRWHHIFVGHILIIDIKPGGSNFLRSVGILQGDTTSVAGRTQLEEPSLC
jgi:hypothetical protein